MTDSLCASCRERASRCGCPEVEAAKTCQVCGDTLTLRLIWENPRTISHYYPALDEVVKRLPLGAVVPCPACCAFPLLPVVSVPAYRRDRLVGA